MWKQRTAARWLACAGFVVAMISLQAGLCLAGWLGEVPTSDSPDDAGLQGSQSIAVDANGNLHMVWLNNTGLMYREYLRDSGWAGAAERLDALTERAGTPCIAVDNAGNVHVIWWVYNGGVGDIYYREKHVLTGWDATPTLLSSPIADDLSPSIAVDSQGVVHVVWCKNQTLIGPKIRYVSKDPVSGWGNGYIISQAEGGITPFICVDSQDNLHVVWIGGNYDIYYRKCTSGVGWDASPTRLTSEGPQNGEPCIVADGLGSLHVVWRLEVADEIKYKRYTPGVGWDSVPTAFYPADSTHGRFPAIAADQLGNVHVVWENNAIMYRHFDPAVGWSAPEALTPTDWHQNPSIAVDACGNLGVIYVHYAERTAYLKRWVNDATAGSSKTIAPEGLICRAYPSPFGGSTQILYQLPAALSTGGKMRLEVLDAEGRVIRTLVEGQSAPGEHSTAWNGSNENGRPVAAGIYYVRLTAARLHGVYPIVLVR